MSLKSARFSLPISTAFWHCSMHFSYSFFSKYTATENRYFDKINEIYVIYQYLTRYIIQVCHFLWFQLHCLVVVSKGNFKVLLLVGSISQFFLSLGLQKINKIFSIIKYNLLSPQLNPSAAMYPFSLLLEIA